MGKTIILVWPKNDQEVAYLKQIIQQKVYSPRKYNNFLFQLLY